MDSFHKAMFVAGRLYDTHLEMLHSILMGEIPSPVLE